MKPTYPCNDIARSYLERYESILAEMIRGMTQAELTDSISHDFIVRMIPHHRAAIEMSENLLRYTTNLPLQRIARRIIREQTQSIAQLEQALPLCGQPAGPQALRDYRRRAEQIQTRMFRAMENARRDNRLNCDFMSEMIPHHRGAVELSRNALRFSLCPQLLPILEAIIRSQTRGIHQMQALARQLGCSLDRNPRSC